MPKSITNTVVFANGGKSPFSSHLFDERELCDEFGALDQGQIKANEIIQCRYAEGKYEFSIVPDQIVIRSYRDQKVLPPILIDAAEKIVRAIEPMRKIISVGALGTNCEATFSAQEVGSEGKELCLQMTMSPIAKHLLEGQSLYAGSTAFICFTNKIQYTIRVEPEHAVQGRDIFTDVNGHQNIKKEEPLQEKLDAVGEIRGQIEQFHRQILTLKEK